jgi:hypothetical protein
MRDTHLWVDVKDHDVLASVVLVLVRPHGLHVGAAALGLKFVVTRVREER